MVGSCLALHAMLSVAPRYSLVLHAIEDLNGVCEGMYRTVGAVKK